MPPFYATQLRLLQKKLCGEGYTTKHIKHTEINLIVDYLSTKFKIESEYMLGIKDKRIFDTNDPKIASIYAVRGILKTSEPV